MKNPASVTPKFGTLSSMRRSSEYENSIVPSSTASVALKAKSRYQSRM